jgi:hypothetical protein
MVKVDMVHDNMKNMKLEVPPDDTMLTLRDVITRMVQWRRTYIDVDPSVATSASTTASQPNIAPGSIFPETQPDQMQPCPSPIREQPHPSPPRTQSTLLPAPDQMQPPTTLPKMKKNVCAKTQPQQKTSSKATKGKQPLK